MNLIQHAPVRRINYPTLGEGPKEDIFTPRLSDILITTDGLIGAEMGAIANAVVAPQYKAVVAPNGEVIQIASKGYALLDDNYLQEQIDTMIAESDGDLVLHSRIHPRPWATSWSIVEKEPIGSLVYGDTEYQVGFVTASRIPMTRRRPSRYVAASKSSSAATSS